MKQVGRQVEKILDEAMEPRVEVIVQMRTSPSAATLALAAAAGAEIARARLAGSPRDLLTGTGAAEAVPTESAAIPELRAASHAVLNSLRESPLIGSAMARAAEGMAAAMPRALWTSQSMVLELDRDELARLAGGLQEIESVSPNRRLMVPPTMETRQDAVESMDLLSSTWGLDHTKALAAWGVHDARGKGVMVGILDTGIDAKHPDLAGRVTKWAEFDSNGNRVVGSEPHDSHHHGTHCAGTIAGGNTSGRAIGMAPQATLAAALVLHGTLGGTDAQVLAGLDWMLDSGVDVISMSLGGFVLGAETPPVYTRAIVSCLLAGIPVVVAIGNEGHQTSGSPGSDYFALSTGAIDRRNRIAGFSGGRTQVIEESEVFAPGLLPLPYSKPDLVAPGIAVYSAAPGGAYKSLNGSSMATPHVAGAIAQLLGATSIREKLAGEKRSRKIRELIAASVDDLGEAGQDHRFGFGGLNVMRALDFARQGSF